MKLSDIFSKTAEIISAIGTLITNLKTDLNTKSDADIASVRSDIAEIVDSAKNAINGHVDSTVSAAATTIGSAISYHQTFFKGEIKFMDAAENAPAGWTKLVSQQYSIQNNFNLKANHYVPSPNECHVMAFYGSVFSGNKIYSKLTGKISWFDFQTGLYGDLCSYFSTITKISAFDVVGNYLFVNGGQTTYGAYQSCYKISLADGSISSTPSLTFIGIWDMSSKLSSVTGPGSAQFVFLNRYILTIGGNYVPDWNTLPYMCGGLSVLDTVANTRTNTNGSFLIQNAKCINHSDTVGYIIGGLYSTDGTTSAQNKVIKVTFNSASSISFEVIDDLPIANNSTFAGCYKIAGTQKYRIMLNSGNQDIIFDPNAAVGSKFTLQTVVQRFTYTSNNNIGSLSYISRIDNIPTLNGLVMLPLRYIQNHFVMPEESAYGTNLVANEQTCVIRYTGV